MCTEHRDLTWTLMLLLLSGVLCGKWNVDYQPLICAVKGSSVVIPCSFQYPPAKKIKFVMWDHENYDMLGPFVYDSRSADTSSKYQYIGDKHHNCSLRVNQVEHKDAGTYRFRFESNSRAGKWTGQGGSILKIVDAIAVVKRTNGDTVKEGDSVTLSCSWCDGGVPSSAFVWLKNGEPFSEGPSLSFKDISFANSGNYTCSLKAHEGSTSGVQHVNVEHGPKNTSVSVRPSTEVHAGSSITLSCSSHANPPEIYTWFRKYDELTVRVGNKSELHLKQVSPAADGEYLCSATNRHGGQNSSVVTLKVKAHSPYSTFTRSAILIATVAAVTALLFVTAVVTAVRRLNGKRTRAPETEPGEDVQNAVYLNWPVVDNSQEGNGCEILYAAVDFNTKRKTNMQQQMDSRNDDEEVIYSTIYSLCAGSKTEPFIR
ncbi:B-cell receptor CD22 [Scophthalmus maximus]|uniref:B-cell receptor CD22 n=1 Tax=Scophthalmus maximus TaxID=52904 RepID=UPI001FA91F1C|nr:B-cell receptor CD22 [Scophthalmus maximus]XP_035472376.2 B-cell receptor CD22 [Scophthalmus maximus]